MWKPCCDLHPLSSSPQGTKGCLGEACFTLQRTGSITAHFAACWQGTIPAFVSHPPSPCSTGSTAWSPTSVHTSLLGSKLCQGWLPCSAIHSSRPARVMGDGESRLPSARALVTDQKSEVKEHSGKLQGHTLLLVLSRSFCGGLPTLHMHDSSHVTLTKLKAP